MPTYDYKCRNCNKEVEIFHSISAEPETVCPLCKTEGLEKMVSSGSGIIFKGSGFYETDYKKKSKGEAKEPAVTCKNESKGGSCACKEG